MKLRKKRKQANEKNSKTYIINLLQKCKVKVTFQLQVTT